jgi:phosphatidate cytidylyltransferase
VADAARSSGAALTAPAPSGGGPGDAGGAPAPKSPGWSLRWRVVSGLLFVPLLIVLARAGELAFTTFVALQVVLGLLEFYRMMKGKDLAPHVLFGVLAGLGVVGAAYRPVFAPVGFLAAAAVMLVLSLGLRRAEGRGIVESLAVTVFGVVYVGWLSAHLVLLRELPWLCGAPYAAGASYVLLAFFITWSCDTGAYAFGRMFGRNRPWTTISPRKSVEGAAGGLAMALVGAFVARAWFAPYLHWWDAAVLGVVVGIAAQVGDLVESLLKRDARHGDSSDFIPGHGGILDRFDSLYFGAPLVYWYLRLAVFRVP